jgi:hypothetical protein
MPLPGNTYIIFLKAFPATGDFEIITGYELNNGIVTPLDGRDLLNDQKLEKFTQYEGMKQELFLQKLSQKGGIKQ